MKNSEERLSFGEFTLDRARRGLFRGSERVHLTSKPLEALILLVDQRGRVVSKDELLAAVWKDTAVTDGVLVQAVRQIRRALDDDAENPRYLQTVPREGYRFVGRVALQPADDGAPAAGAAPSRSADWWSLAAIAATLVTALAAWQLATASREPRAPAAVRAGEAVTRVVPLSPGGISAVKPVFSPDGRALVFVSDAPEATGVLDLFLLPTGGGDLLRLTHGANASGDLPVFTADSQQLVFSRYRTGGEGSRVPDLWKVSAFGGAPVRYVAGGSGAGFSPDGTSIAYTRDPDRALVVGAAARRDNPTVVTTPGFTPRWSPDGRWIAYTTSYPEGGPGDLWIVSTSLANPRRLTQRAHQICGLAWSADSAAIVFAAKIGNAFHLQRVAIATGSIEPLTSGVGEYSSPSISPDGRQLAFALVRPVRDLIYASPADRADTRALTTNEYHRWSRLSPSSRRVATVVQRSAADDVLYVIDTGTGNSRQMSDVPAAYPSWADDERVVYLTPREGDTTEVRQVHVTSGESSTLARVAGSASWLAVRPGTSEIAYVQHVDGTERVVLRDVASGVELAVAQGPTFEALRWRPDGTLLAWSGSRVWAGPGTNGISVFEPGSRTQPRRVVSDGYGPSWGKDGSLYFLRHLGEHDGAGIWRMDLASGVETQVRRLARIDFFDVAGDALVYGRSTGRAQIFVMPLR